MQFSTTLEGMESIVSSRGQIVNEALQRATSTGETADFLRAQQDVANYTNLVGFYSSTIKFMHDMIAGIIQKI
ncbi:type III secretion protein F [Cupriavidus gilardii J11]|uniref:Type III secretion protein F n=1 Tax=Cupriavidus gilardii J11 TaxID=936133 RepID=A0A562BIQ1_9BURK|nr:EscF/YscF/HrpA family type III secretion system needle major subunit [Cupriavidus gilardii]TWG84971.1 type III secretion protein F [Cupriavidus gilardii J11]